MDVVLTPGCEKGLRYRATHHGGCRFRRPTVYPHPTGTSLHTKRCSPSQSRQSTLKYSRRQLRKAQRHLGCIRNQ